MNKKGITPFICKRGGSWCVFTPYYVYGGLSLERAFEIARCFPKRIKGGSNIIW